MIKPIITDCAILKKPSEKVSPEDDIKSIIQDLKDTIASQPHSIGLSAPQIGIQKCVCIVRLPVGVNQETKKVEFTEKILINPIITEKDKRVQLKGEGCSSFAGISVNTDRYIYITLEYLDESLKLQAGCMQDWESFAIQHEVDHLNGILLFDRKHKAR